MSSPQLKVQDELVRLLREANEKTGLCMKEYNKLSRRYELLVKRKREFIKLRPEELEMKELLKAIWAKLSKIFRKPR